MLKVDRLDASIGPTPILRAIELVVPAGSMCGLIGRNGAGKTTVMRTIMGLLRATAGCVEFEGKPGADGWSSPRAFGNWLYAGGSPSSAPVDD